VYLCSVEYVKTLRLGEVRLGGIGVVKLMKNSKGDEFDVKLLTGDDHGDDVLWKTLMGEFEAMLYLFHPCVCRRCGRRLTNSCIYVND
jgi:hypothetical protein